MALLVTGAKGYIGHHFMQQLSQKDNQNCLFVDLPELDISNAQFVDAYFSRHKIVGVLHLAAMIDNNNLLGLLNANLVGLYNLLAACKKYGVSYFCFVSTNNVYNLSAGEFFSEGSERGPLGENIYGLTKYYGELMVENMLSDTAVKYSIVRLGDVFGPNQKVGALLKTVVENAVKGRPQKLYGIGDRTRDYIYIDDVTAGLEHIVKNRLEGMYNLATGVGTSVKQIVEIAQELYAPQQELIRVDVAQEDHSKVTLNVEKLARTGFTTKISFAEGLKRIVRRNKEDER